MPHVYIAYHVDPSGVATANYKLAATDDDAAYKEAQQYLANHESIEVWNGSRLVVRLMRGKGTAVEERL